MYYSYVEIEYVATSFSPARTDLALKLLTLISSTMNYNALQKESLKLFEGFCVFGFREFFINFFCILMEVNKTMYGNNEDVPNCFWTICIQNHTYVMSHLQLCGMSLHQIKTIVSIDHQ
jgi:hypothetical protein